MICTRHKKSFLIVGTVFLFSCFVPTHGSVDFSTPTIINIPKSDANLDLRSIYTQIPQGTTITTKINFDKTAFNQSQELFYLGAKDVPETDSVAYAVSRVNTQSPLPFVTGIASTEELKGKIISNLVTFNNSYLAATAVVNKVDDKLVYLIVNPENSGNTVWKTQGQLNDASATPAATNEIKALATSSDYIFAAVSASGDGVTWETVADAGDYRGVAMVYPDTKALGLKVLDANNIDPLIEGNKAAQLSVLASSDPTNIVVSFFKDGVISPITRAIFSPATAGESTVDMCWDSKLQRLFVAMSDVTRDDNNKEGGVVSVVVGRIEKDSTTGISALKFVPIVVDPISAASTIHFTDNSLENVIGFYYTEPTNIKVSTKKVRAMHTSTGKTYLIVYSVVSSEFVGGYDGVFALPLNSSVSNAKNIGTLSKIPVYINTPGSLPGNEFTVGVSKGQAPSLTTESLTDLFVHGDTVYMCCKGTAPSPQAMGIFQSTAIFGPTGDIVGWTTWQRVMGSIDRVWAGNIGSRTGDFYYLASESTDLADDSSNTVKITQWGPTEYASVNQDGTVNTNRNLSPVLSQIFPQENGGIFQIIDFNNQIDGLANNGQLSMMAVLGYDKVALVQTGEWKNSRLEPITKFETNGASQNVVVFSGSAALSAIAPLCYAEVSRTTGKDKGYLFVCGLHGVVVLQQGNGKGWDASVGLGKVTDLSGYFFTQLTPASGNSFDSARKLICRDNLLYVLTKNNLYKIDFTGTFIPTLGETKIDLKLPAATKFSDFLLIPNASDTSPARSLILGTTAGLYSSQTTDYKSIVFGAAAKIGTNSDPAIHLNYISEDKRYASAEGNLYVLQTSFIDETGKIYRYYVNGSSVLPINMVTGSITSTDGLFVDLNYFRGNFVTDGSFGYSLLGKGLGQTDLFHVYEMTTDAADKNYNLTWDIGINTELNWYIGTVIRNSASGSLYVPGDWGLIVNE